MVLSRDVTREHRAVETLRRRDEMLRLAQRAGGVGTFEWDFENLVAECSAEFFHLFGQPGREGTITAAEWATFVHPDDRDWMSAHLARALAGQEPATADYRIISATGELRWLTYAGEIQKTSRGIRMLGSVLDITERKRLEDELREHAAAIQQARAAAESANRVKDEFLATLSHELRTPLNAILGYAQILKTNQISPEHRQRAIEIIERNAAAQAQLVDDLLDMSRITVGKLRLDWRDVEIETVLRQAAEGIKPAADAKRIRFEVQVECPADRLIVRGDAARLQQVFWNLLSNAVKFTPAGGRIAARLRDDQDHVETSVADTGIGIGPEFLPHIFEPFRQADQGYTRTQGGLGLGLAISRQLVELHGGTIRAASDGDGRGATFAIRLPRLQPGA